MKEEIIQLCDSFGNPSGTAPRSVCHHDPSMIQMVVYLFIVNSSGEIYLQKRSEKKDAWPGKWDTAVGGHVGGGEDIFDALKREACEELGIVIDGAEFLFRQVNKKESETEMSFVYRTVYDGPFSIDNDEVIDSGFFSMEEIREKTGTGMFTPNLEKQFRKIYGN